MALWELSCRVPQGSVLLLLHLYEAAGNSHQGIGNKGNLCFIIPTPEPGSGGGNGLDGGQLIEAESRQDGAAMGRHYACLGVGNTNYLFLMGFYSP